MPGTLESSMTAGFEGVSDDCDSSDIWFADGFRGELLGSLKQET
jgi:hypothetical protein